MEKRMAHLIPTLTMSRNFCIFKVLAYEFEELTVYQRDKELFLEVLDVTDNDTGLVMRPLELSSDSE